MHPADLYLELKRRDPAYRENAQIGIAIGGSDVGRELAEQNAFWNDPVKVQAAIQQFKAQVIEADARGELTADQAHWASVYSKLEDTGLITAEGLPVHLALNPGPSVSNRDETREAR